jgi:hypothetical protein
MCAPRVTRQALIDTIFKFLPHTRQHGCIVKVTKMGVFFTAAMVRAFRSARSRDNGGTYCVRIIAEVKNTPMLARVWQELEYRIDVCRVTRGAHIEQL